MGDSNHRGESSLRLVFAGVTALIFVQLLIAATMRHQHAGLAIPDFPAAYGKLWPDTDAQAILRYNQNRLEVLGYKSISAFQVVLQMVHRIMAGAILASILWLYWRARRALGSGHVLTRWTMVWVGLIAGQILLGAGTIWTGKSADIATAHVVVGALCLAMGALGTIISFALSSPPAYKVTFGRGAQVPLIEDGTTAPRQTIA